MHTGTSEARRVAVVVVHGVADQRPGETASSVVELLVASAPAGTRYEAIGSEAYLLNVAPLAPAIAKARAQRSDAKRQGAAAVQGPRPVGPLRFPAPGWEAPVTMAEARSQARPARAEGRSLRSGAPPAAKGSRDMG
jgi:hypothetical protein